MTGISIRRWAGALTAVAAMLAGCGGGSGDTASTAKTVAVTSLDSRVQPVEAVQDVAQVKSRNISAAPKAAVVALGELSLTKVDTPSSFGPRLVGQARDIAATKSSEQTHTQWQWKDTAVGGKLAAISFRAEGAYGVRLGVLVKQLPGSAILRVYTQTNPGAVFQISGQEILQVIGRNQAAGDMTDQGRTWWTPDTGEGEATLEVELPPGVGVSALDVAIPQLSHIFVNLSLPTEEEYKAQVETAKINESDPCNLDATCYSESASDRNAVARMSFVSGGLSYLCTGTLMNEVNLSGKPYFLSANHCISTQTAASTLQTNWFYRSPTCGSGNLQATSIRKTGGAQLLYASSATDMSFMLLNDTPPAGAVFAGWNANPVTAGTSVMGLHHPSGDLLKISFGQVVGQSSCQSTGGAQFQCNGTSGNFYQVTWNQGTTEGGSSGSAIFANGRVIGTLYGGSAVCTNKTSADYYGRFDIAFNAALKNWLSAAPTSGNRTAVYRFYNATTGAHFFTASAEERNSIVNNLPLFAYEGVAFYVYGASGSGLSPVYRFFNTQGGTHFYTISSAERDSVQANLPGYNFEGTGWYAQTANDGSATPIYRFYRQSSKTHFYTVSSAERDSLIAGNADYRYEGPAYYVWNGL